MFAAPVPTFNLKGRLAVSTAAGGFVSIVIAIVTMLFATHKLQHMLMRVNPLVTAQVINDAFDSTDMFDTHDTNFMIAFALFDDNSGVAKNDTNYFKWLGRYRDQKETRKE